MSVSSISATDAVAALNLRLLANANAQQAQLTALLASADVGTTVNVAA